MKPGLFVLALMMTGCIHWSGDRPVYYQRVIDMNDRPVPGHPKSYDDIIQKQVMIGNPFTVPIRMSVHCDDWSWRDSQVESVILAPQQEFSALVESTRADQWKQACKVKSWRRMLVK